MKLCVVTFPSHRMKFSNRGTEYLSLVKTTTKLTLSLPYLPRYHSENAKFESLQCLLGASEGYQKSDPA